MELSGEEVNYIKAAFRDYRGTRITKSQREVLGKYDVSTLEDRGRLYFVRGKVRLRVPLTKTHGRASKNVASGLIRMIRETD